MCNRCAAATTAAPGSATAGQPASETRPTPWGAAAGWLSHWLICAKECSFLSRLKIVMSCIGNEGEICCKKARADFAFSAIYTSILRAISCTEAGSHKGVGAAPRPTGMRCKAGASVVDVLMVFIFFGKRVGLLVSYKRLR